MKSLLLTVKGVVQGVGFRYYCYRHAMAFGLKGYARNMDNGDVEILIQGDENELNGFINEIKTGPRHAHVTSVNIRHSESCEIFTVFEIK